MSPNHPTRLPRWIDWLGLVLLAFAAPAIASLIHSIYVYQRGYRFYNAEAGGDYFLEMLRGGEASSFLPVLIWLADCCVYAIPAFVVLLLFRKRPVYFWAVWGICIGLLTWLFFDTEFAIQ